jgi:hypothetical protein
VTQSEILGGWLRTVPSIQNNVFKKRRELLGVGVSTCAVVER